MFEKVDISQVTRLKTIHIVKTQKYIQHINIDYFGKKCVISLQKKTIDIGNTN